MHAMDLPLPLPQHSRNRWATSISKLLAISARLNPSRATAATIWGINRWGSFDNPCLWVTFTKVRGSSEEGGGMRAGLMAIAFVTTWGLALSPSYAQTYDPASDFSAVATPS